MRVHSRNGKQKTRFCRGRRAYRRATLLSLSVTPFDGVATTVQKRDQITITAPMAFVTLDAGLTHAQPVRWACAATVRPLHPI